MTNSNGGKTAKEVKNQNLLQNHHPLAALTERLNALQEVRTESNAHF